ncbi:ras-specific guanine nucleotide-releasing factor RalGPS1-like [Zophobas morio]|uniref:ras-specific guanine nucleotide-releasing factor RalGPS1-like n=1 Tax=Zophobas morio TaxID=2755281 RepID=UPI003083AC7E
MFTASEELDKTEASRKIGFDSPYKKFSFQKKLNGYLANLKADDCRGLGSESALSSQKLKKKHRRTQSSQSFLFSEKYSDSVEDKSEATTKLPKTALLLFEPIDVAVFCCIKDSELLRKIKPAEFTNCAWSKPTKDLHAKNIVNMISSLNEQANIVATEVLSNGTAGGRAKVIEYYIKVAKELLTLQNFNSLKGILSGLQGQPVYRLRKSWSAVSPKKKKLFKELSRLMDTELNYKEYRDVLKSSEPPCIPYLGVYLTDFTFIYHAFDHPSELRLEELINDFQHFQETAVYPLIFKKSVEFYYKNFSPHDDNENYRLSLLLEQKYNSNTIGRVPASTKDTTKNSESSVDLYKEKEKLCAQLVRLARRQKANAADWMEMPPEVVSDAWTLAGKLYYLQQQIVKSRTLKLSVNAE